MGNNPELATKLIKGLFVGLDALLIQEEYRTGEHNLVDDFYKPCLAQASRYDRAVGYFRSSVFVLIGPDLVEFAKSGGIIRLVCSPSLTVEDSEAISAGYEKRKEFLGNALLEDIEQILAVEALHKNTEALATLVAVGVIDIKVVFMPNLQGIYHEKVGIFSDDNGNCVGFKGSINETWSAWHIRGNYETIDVFCSWNGGRDRRQAERNRKYFESLWLGEVNNLEVYDFPKIAKERLLTLSLSSLDEIEANKLTDFTRVGCNSAEYESPSLLSNRRKPLPHQLAAIESWQMQGKQGILEHATGSGKTFTALTALKDHLCEGGVALVLVPDRLLHRQWAEEIRTEIDDVTILKAGDGHNRWKKNSRLRQFTQPGAGMGRRVVLATMATARTQDFIRGFCAGDHLMVIADEVHEIGSIENSKSLCIEAGVRLGLSATPRRYGDPAGTKRIFDYFGDVVEPVFTLVDAICQGRLVEYEYHPEPIRLTAEESEAWETATREISREFARSKRDDNGKPTPSARLQNMLIQRSRIAKKASAKIPYAIRTIKEHFREGESWLIYCEDQCQLKEIMTELKQSGCRPCEYHTGMRGDSDASLEWFKSFGGIMVSIRCLDQGVDIPKISHAIILASSQNPRQFIQRRGRVLRVCEGKYKAVIFDAVVVPLCLELEPGQFSLLKSELQRSIQFSNTAINKSGANKLITIAIELGIDPAEVGLVETYGIEEDINDGS